jgi:hypothetical protein
MEYLVSKNKSGNKIIENLEWVPPKGFQELPLNFQVNSLSSKCMNHSFPPDKVILSIHNHMLSIKT